MKRFALRPVQCDCRSPSVTLRWGVIGAAMVALGCTETTPYGVVPVSGKITYEDGTVIPADEMILNFRSMETPIDPKTHPRTGMCRVRVEDGTFDSVTTYAHADGVIRGKHKVSVGVRGANGLVVVPKEYTSELTTPLIVDAADAPFDFRIAKP